MHTKLLPPDNEPSLFHSASSLIKGIGRRFLVHFLAIIAAASFADIFATAWPRFSGNADDFTMFMYIGIICLFPRGIGRTPDWIFPTAMGALQTGALLLLGTPAPTAILFGGVQTWLQRLLRKKGKMGWEWTVSPFLLAGIAKSFELFIATSQSLTPLYITFPLIAIFSWKKQKKHAAKAQSAAISTDDPAALPQQQAELPQFAGAPDDSKDAFIKTLAPYKESMKKLSAKRRSLPEELRLHLEGIVQSTDGILRCMIDDPADRPAGEKFLSRYLDATHTVVDEHIRLSRVANKNADIQDALDQSGELLARLDKAFTGEHGNLLQNDVLNFTVELNTMDKLLKMKGH